MSVLPLTEGARRVDRRGLKNLPAFHHHHPLAKALYQPQIVGDKQAGGRKLYLQTLQQRNDLRLQNEVKIRDGLIEDQGGRTTSARARQTRCSCPPLSWCGRLSSRCGERSTACIIASTRAWRSSRAKRNRWRRLADDLIHRFRGFTAL